MQCSDVDGLLGRLQNVQVLMHCSGVDARFECLCNVQVLMQCSGVYILHGIVKLR